LAEREVYKKVVSRLLRRRKRDIRIKRGVLHDLKPFKFGWWKRQPSNSHVKGEKDGEKDIFEGANRQEKTFVRALSDKGGQELFA